MHQDIARPEGLSLLAYGQEVQKLEMGAGYKWGLISLELVQATSIARKDRYVFLIKFIQHQTSRLIHTCSRPFTTLSLKLCLFLL